MQSAMGMIEGNTTSAHRPPVFQLNVLTRAQTCCSAFVREEYSQLP